MQITSHFNLSEFTDSDVAKEIGIDLNDFFDEFIIENIITLTKNILEPVRIQFGLPI